MRGFYRKNFVCDENIAYILGAVLSDGYVWSTKDRYGTTYTVGLKVYDKSKYFAERFYDVAKNAGLNPFWYKPRLKIGRGFSEGKTLIEYRVVIRCKKLYEMIKKLKDEPEKIPQLLKTRREVLAFLHGFFDGDGNYSKIFRKRGKTGGHHQHQIQIRNVNNNLLEVIKALFVRLGYHPHMYPTSLGKRKAIGRVQLSRKAEVLSFLNFGGMRRV